MLPHDDNLGSKRAYLFLAISLDIDQPPRGYRYGATARNPTILHSSDREKLTRDSTSLISKCNVRLVN